MNGLLQALVSTRWIFLYSPFSSKNYQNTASLKNALIACWEDLSEEVVRRSTTSVLSRLDAAVKAKGGHVE